MRILIVEDNRNLARGLRHNLELEGYDVEVAYDGTTGLARARDGNYDLIVLDLMIPHRMAIRSSARCAKAKANRVRPRCSFLPACSS